ncbi:unnamed protein product [Protopolystoma xenopodis]|uniref:Uncharacterized protein n=1 Tax=Protopolystoma xenopodis TaxID=117903 RepID=A0A448WAW5_9PLAT|nr:unnamed protein product [Protopolystoma xenopodis]
MHPALSSSISGSVINSLSVADPIASSSSAISAASSTSSSTVTSPSASLLLVRSACGASSASLVAGVSGLRHLTASPAVTVSATSGATCPGSVLSSAANSLIGVVASSVLGTTNIGCSGDSSVAGPMLTSIDTDRAAGDSNGIGGSLGAGGLVVDVSSGALLLQPIAISMAGTVTATNATSDGGIEAQHTRALLLSSSGSGTLSLVSEASSGNGQSLPVSLHISDVTSTAVNQMPHDSLLTDHHLSACGITKSTMSPTKGSHLCSTDVYELESSNISIFGSSSSLKRFDSIDRTIYSGHSVSDASAGISFVSGHPDQQQQLAGNLLGLTGSLLDERRTLTVNVSENELISTNTATTSTGAELDQNSLLLPIPDDGEPGYGQSSLLTACDQTPMSIVALEVSGSLSSAKTSQ